MLRCIHVYIHLQQCDSKPTCKKCSSTFRDGVSPTKEGSWLDRLEDAINKYDMVTYAYWFITPERMGKGAFSPYGFLDAMYWAVVMEDVKQGIDFDEIFAFLTPFSGPVWFSFLGLMVGTGLMYRFLEVARNAEDFPDGPQGCCNGAAAKEFY